MDLEGRIFDESEYAFSEDEDCNVDSVLEQERCGICIDIVIDRGALDCCDHWFCFACIDNWAAITNLCPICKMEFQIITCLPVYDTIRGIRSEDHPISRNDDWCIEAKSSALSFPSDYISEDAVKCLEGDGCKIRNSLQMTEEDLTFDTSIACDSCDTWYHAFCVGFNPELTCESTWFCPRCINNEVQQNSVMFSSQNHGKYAIIQSADTGWTGDPSLLGKVSVSVADAGETAVVVSLIDGKDKMDSRKSLLNEIETELEKMIPTSLENLNFNDSVMDLHPKDDSCNRLSCNNLGFSDYKGHYTITDVDNSDTFFDISPEIIDFQSDGDVKEATLPSLFLQDDGLRKSTNDITESKLSSSTSQQVSFPFCNVTTSGDEKQINKLETTSNSVYSEDSEALSPVAFVQSEVKIEPGSKPNNTSHGLVAVSHESTTTSCCKDRMVEMCQKDEDDCNLLEKQKMKQLHSPNVQKRDCIRKRETESLYPTKKLKSDGRSKIFPPESQSASNSQDWAGKNRGGSMLYVKTEELETADIMSIVRETDCSSQDLQIGMKFSNKAMDSKDGTCGLRVKKVMRRIGEKKESSILAQELGKEIREVVQQKGLNDGGKMNDFDENLLAAFRAATVKSKAQLSGHPNLVFAGANKHILVKGRKRENLTKKIYGTASGKRRHAWVRDLEIEFWKHRCRSAQSEKVETLQSVLELLKRLQILPGMALRN
ncbi:hypothetical protein HPP92_009606 [Vanilla planifolia]|uniref:Uncharacterized protein n=1 Tax=Vanilla planifolia TaxID=51239 RepID=A0A835V907_VANPL|nr:hypothetical protein HPP92_009606 [Vanilla planifolia]